MVATLVHSTSDMSPSDPGIAATTIHITSTFSAIINADYTVTIQYRSTLRSTVESIALEHAVHPILSALVELDQLKRQYLHFVENHHIILHGPRELPARIGIEHGRYTVRITDGQVKAIDTNGVQWLARHELALPQFWDALIWQLHTHRVFTTKIAEF